MNESSLTREIVQDLGIRVANLTIDNASLQAQLNAAQRRIQELESKEKHEEGDSQPAG